MDGDGVVACEGSVAAAMLERGGVVDVFRRVVDAGDGAGVAEVGCAAVVRGGDVDRTGRAVVVGVVAAEVRGWVERGRDVG
jgi:hypothetical protein